MMASTRESFGAHVRSLRRARGFTQQRLATTSGLCPDTIRRLECGAFSPSLDTLSKLAVGLRLSLGTLFDSFELGPAHDRHQHRALLDLIRSRPAVEIGAITRVVHALLDQVDAMVDARDSGSPERAR